MMPKKPFNEVTPYDINLSDNETVQDLDCNNSVSDEEIGTKQVINQRKPQLIQTSYKSTNFLAKLKQQPEV